VDAQGSITAWIGRLKAGDAEAARPLWETYFHRLVELARRKLGDRPRAVADEEDAALSAFDSFCRRAREGRFPDLNDRTDLWQVLFMLTARKAVNLLRGEARAKRGGGQVRHASALAAADDADAFAEVMGAEPTPELAAQVAEECGRLLDGLGDAELRSVAVAKMEGYSNAEIAERLGRSLATVERKLQLIRKTWEKEARP
jgi:DNA-directed RNA polymerase specialized sigma24 family protein